MKKLPVYKLRINEEDNAPTKVEYIALVEEPAILTNWLTFSKENNFQRFSADNERRIIMGAAMIANMPIYRNDLQKGEHYVILDAEEIMKIVQKYFRNGYQKNFNIEHDENRKVDGVYTFGSIIIDERLGISAPKPFEGLSNGSWVTLTKIDNDDVWEHFIKTGEMKGWSVEGMFSYEYEQEAEEKVLQEIIEIIHSAFN